MARQSGIIKLEGKIGDVSFYKSKDGYLARTKGGVSKERITNDPAFQRTRENGAEFGRSGVSGRLLRTALRPLLLRISDNQMTSRLTQILMKIIKTDQDNARGEREVSNGELAMLQGFDFNQKARLNATLYGVFTVDVDRASGQVSIEVAAFKPNESVAVPQGATHLKFVAGATAVDFAGEAFELTMANSAEIEIGSAEQAAINLSADISAGSVHPIFVVFGVEFFQSVNGVFYPLKNGANNALNLVQILKD